MLGFIVLPKCEPQLMKQLCVNRGGKLLQSRDVRLLAGYVLLEVVYPPGDRRQCTKEARISQRIHEQRIS